MVTWQLVRFTLSNYLQLTMGWCRVLPPNGETQRSHRQELVNREARCENPTPPPPPSLTMPGVAEHVAQTNQLVATVLRLIPPQNEHWEPHEHRGKPSAVLRPTSSGTIPLFSTLFLGRLLLNIVLMVFNDLWELSSA
jgi:hypothetical protein